MGGKKKLTLKQVERMQAKKDEEEKDKKKKEKSGPTSREKRAPGIIPPDSKSEKIVGELKKMPVLTPYAVATRFNIRISVAKDLLEKLKEDGVIQLVSGSHNIKIYKAFD
jgi:small subunit ribosomal protein S25e